MFVGLCLLIVLCLGVFVFWGIVYVCSFGCVLFGSVCVVGLGLLFGLLLFWFGWFCRGVRGGIGVITLGIVPKY